MRALSRTLALSAALALPASAVAQLLSPNPTVLSTRWDGALFSQPLFISATTPDLRHIVIGASAANVLGPASPPVVDGALQYFLIDRQTGERRAVSIGAGGALANLGNPNASGFTALSISDDGNRIVFNSNATNLDPAATSGATHCYLWDRTVGYAVALDVDPTPGLQSWLCGNLTADGRRVVAICSQPVPGVTGFGVCVRNIDSGEIERLAPGRGASLGFLYELGIKISADGSTVVFSGWEGTASVGIQRLDRATGAVINIDPDGGSAASLSLSRDGRWLLADAQLYDHETGELRTVIRRSPLSFPSRRVYDAIISRDGRYVAFRTSAGEFEREITGQSFSSGRFHVYRLDLATDRLDLVSRLDLNGPLALGDQDECELPPAFPIMVCVLNRFTPRISANGRHVAFTFIRSNLAPTYPPGEPIERLFFIKDLGPPPALVEPVPVAIDRSWLWLLAGLLLLSGWLGIRRLPGRVVD